MSMKHSNHIITNCNTCKKELKIPFWKTRFYRGRPANKHFYCSRDCFKVYIKVWSSNFFKSSKSRTPKKCETCQKVFLRRGRNRIDRFCGSECWGEWIRRNWTGEGNPNWKNVKKFQRERTHARYRKWRNTVVERDGKCDICGSTKKLEAHHIKKYEPYPELRYELSNGITLCKNCHIKNPNYSPVTT